MTLLEIIPVWIREIPDILRTQDMCNEAMRIEQYSLAFVPDHLKMQEMCDKAVEIDPFILWHVPDHLKTQEMCIRAVEAGLGLLEYVPDWFVAQGQIKIWHDEYYWHDDVGIIKWYEGYQKRKAQKAKIKEELLPITWHPWRNWDWCMSEDEKKETEKLWN